MHIGREKAALSPSPSPLVQRRRLTAELRRARQQAGLTQEVVADEMDWSLSKIIRIETGAVGVSRNDLSALLRLYGVTNPLQVRPLLELGRDARQQTWWSKYREALPPKYFQYIEYETAAAIIRSHETILVPGLLQTEDYMKAVADLELTTFSAKTIKAIVEVRTQRQDQILNQPDAPLSFFTLDETVIRRFVSDARLARGQISRLLEISEYPRCTIEIVPLAAGLNRGMFEPFALLEFEDPNDQDVLYLEGLHESMLSHGEVDTISAYRVLFEELRAASLGPGGTREFLEQTRAELT
jgi:transcriptional regulator with XRE-family HTH domain